MPLITTQVPTTASAIGRQRASEQRTLLEGKLEWSGQPVHVGLPVVGGTIIRIDNHNQKVPRCRLQAWIATWSSDSTATTFATQAAVVPWCMPSPPRQGPVPPRSCTRTSVPTVPLSSLYRTLAVLEEANIIAPHFGARGLTRYELAEWIMGHHHHFVCLECGAVEDIDIAPGVEQRVDALVAEISELAAFEPTSHVLEIEGRCRRCR